MKSCNDLEINKRNVLIASNRGPVTFSRDENGDLKFTRGGGGLVTALSGLARQIDVTWIACAMTEEDLDWKEGKIPGQKESDSLYVKFLETKENVYQAYYNQISNPLLWFLQHTMWDLPRAPVINKKTWEAWHHGYVAVNRLFANEVVTRVKNMPGKPLVMIQDYHLYLAPRMIRDQLKPQERPTILHFLHIPWPGPAYWSILPPVMLQAILDGMTAADILGFQTDYDALNFVRTCQSYLNRVGVKYKIGRIWYRNHHTHVRDFPISINVQNLERLAASKSVTEHQAEILDIIGDQNLILRIDRIDPSKNIIRGFQAYEELLELYPEHLGSTIFLALLSPSRLNVVEYHTYLNDLMAVSGQINARFGNPDWEPIRVIVSDNYARAVAGLKYYDALLVNAIADGMNLVAKEGPIVNKRAGVLILSDRAGARQQLESGALIISPCDISATANALHQALTMPLDERRRRTKELIKNIKTEDINDWLCRQLDTVDALDL